MASKYKSGISKVLAIIIAIVVIVAAAGAAGVYLYLSNNSSSNSNNNNTQTNSWSIKLSGTSDINMTQAEFETAVANNPQSYNDGVTTWNGTPLTQLVTCAVNKGALSNSVNLTAGYVVEVIGSDGYTKAFNDSRLTTNNIIIANEANGTALSSSYAPLALAGATLANKEKVSQIQEIKILPIQHCSLTIVAANGTSVTLFSNDLALMQSVTYNGGITKNGGSYLGNYTGVKLTDILSNAGFAFTSSNNITVTSLDAWPTNYTYAQVTNQVGSITMYNSTGSTVTPANPVYLTVAYWVNSTNMAPYTSVNNTLYGPLVVIAIGPDGYRTAGNVFAKDAATITIH